MKHTIKSIILLAAILIGGAGQAWASVSTEPNLGKIVYTQSTNDHGSLAFCKDEACTPINTTPDGVYVYSFGLTPVKDGSEKTIGYKVYIKATPDFGYTLEAGDEEGKVSFIKAEVTVAGTDVAGARTRGAAPTVNVGDFIDVTATDTKGVYCVTMPADKNLNLHITATFPERPYLTGVSYIDPTKTGNAQNATTPAGTHVYILDGTETVLGEDGKEMWYVCKTPASANSGAGLMYDHLTLNGDVRLILADDSKMSVESANSSAIINGGRCSLGLYGQSTGTSRGALIAKSTASDQNQHAIKIYGSFIISHCKVTAEGPLGMRSDGDFTISNADVTVTGNSGRAIYISTGNVSITGGKVTAEGSSGIEAPSGAITISNADVTATGTPISAISAGSTGTPVNDKDITITGGKVIATGYEYGIKASGDITISGGQVKAITTKPDNSSYGIYSYSGDIVLGWANATDFIYANKGGRVAKTADGQRFIAYTPGATESDPMTATALISGTSGTDFELSAIEGKMLKPCDGNFVKLIEGVTASATDGESITIGTETLYKVANGVEVTLSATDSDNKKLSSVTVTEADLTDNSDNTFTFTMGTSDVTVTAATFLEKVSYFDPTAEGDNKTKTVFATPLTGNETTLAPGWYVVNEDIDYATVSNYIVLSATGDVNLILADGKKMNIGSAESPVSAYGIRFSPKATLAIYGQGGTTEGSLSIYTNNRNPIENTSGITIYGGNLTVNYRLSTDGTFTIHGGTFNDTRTNSSNATAINAAEINIRGGKVESEVSELYTNDKGTGNINISGGVVNVRCLNTSKGSIDISGGQVTIGANGIYSKKDLTLSWTDAESDFIASGGTFKSEGGSISIAPGKHFLAYNSENTIVAVYDAQTLPDYDSSNFYSFDGKTLKPALEITLPEGITATGTDVFTDEIAGTYAIYDVPVTLDGTYYTASEGYNLSGFTVKDADDKELSIDNGNEFTMPATAVTVTPTETAISATDPTITAQPSDLGKLEWGDTSGNELSIEVQEVEVHTLSYQWYSNSTNSNTDGTAIDGATSASYAVSTEQTGTFYYYCIVTATRNDNNETASVSSDVATVTVSPKSYDYSTNTISCAITQDENGYSVHLTEGEGSANQLSISGTVADLDYSRTLTAPTESNKDVTIGNESANLYTVCLPFTPDTGTGVTYYTLSKVEGTTLSFVEISGSPVAFTPYLVAVTGNNNFTEDCSNVNFETTATIHSTPVNGYTFTGTLTGLKNADAQGKYILQADNKWGKVTSENSDARIPPFRAYIEGPASGARLLNSSFDGDATGIQNIRTVDADGTEQWYDLNGRRIAKPTTKGVYIRNGKKTTN